LGAVALFQMAVWMGGGLLLLGGGLAFASVAFGYSLSLGFFAWAVCFFLLGYLLYASMLGALGALAPNMREGSQFTFVLLVPLMIPLWLNSVFLNAPHSVLATVLSLFPLSAPTSMMTRLAAGNVPAWQPIVSLLGLAVTTYLFVALAARFFRADSLLSSASLSWGRLGQEFRARVRS
jgi:ABC-2 type transport system permease protein